MEYIDIATLGQRRSEVKGSQYWTDVQSPLKACVSALESVVRNNGAIISIGMLYTRTPSGADLRTEH